MVVGLGLDVVELDRIGAALERFGPRFLARVLTDYERSRVPAKHPVPFVAARFAAKEAASKALGTGFRHGVGMRTLEVRDLPSGKPEIHFLGPALERFQALGAVNAHLSLTHGRDVAAAVVVIEA